MDIVICGAGEVGGHTAEVLTGEGHSVTIIDKSTERLHTLTDTLDVRTLEGNAAGSTILREAGANTADLVIAATDADEVNIVAASVGKGLGAKRAIARLHHRAFFEQHELSYERHFGIDRLICPEYATATAIARSLRNPAALAIENFAGGNIEMQEFPVTAGAPAVGTALADVRMPPRSRLAAISRGSDVLFPGAGSRVQVDDRVVLVGNADVFDEARKQFRAEKPKKRNIVLSGGTPMAVWLCRALRDRMWSTRLFETRRERAVELAEKLDWVTVLNADPSDRGVFAEERIALADVYIALNDDDEDNIVGAVMAKAGGVTECIAVVQRSRYLDLLYHIGVDRSYSPGKVAAREILDMLDDSPLRLLATLAGEIDAYIVRVSSSSDVRGLALRDVNLSPNWVVGAIRRDEDVWVPGADDTMQPGDAALIIGRRGKQDQLERLFISR
jgi:trk system potassium uptake protein TrkA